MYDTVKGSDWLGGLFLHYILPSCSVGCWNLNFMLNIAIGCVFLRKLSLLICMFMILFVLELASYISSFCLFSYETFSPVKGAKF